MPLTKRMKTHWEDAITKDMETMKVAFQIFCNGKKAPNGYLLLTATWCLTLKWKISDEGHAKLLRCQRLSHTLVLLAERW